MQTTFKFRVIQQRFYAVDYVYEIEAENEEEAEELVLNGYVDSLSEGSIYGINEDEITSVTQIG